MQNTEVMLPCAETYHDLKGFKAPQLQECMCRRAQRPQRDHGRDQRAAAQVAAGHAQCGARRGVGGHAPAGRAAPAQRLHHPGQDARRAVPVAGCGAPPGAMYQYVYCLKCVGCRAARERALPAQQFYQTSDCEWQLMLPAALGGQVVARQASLATPAMPPLLCPCCVGKHDWRDTAADPARAESCRPRCTARPVPRLSA